MFTKGLLFGFILFNKYVISDKSDDCSDELMMPQVNMLSCNNHIILPFTQMPMELSEVNVSNGDALYVSPIVEGACARQSVSPGSFLFECIDQTNATLTVFQDDDCSMDPSVEILSCENGDGTIGSCSCSCPESTDNAYAKINIGADPTCQTSGQFGNVEFPIAVGVCYFDDTTGSYTQYFCGKYNNDTNIYAQSHAFATLAQCKAAQPLQTRDVPETCGIYATNQTVPGFGLINITWQITACTQTLDCSDDILSLSSNIKYITSLIISIIIAFIVQ